MDETNSLIEQRKAKLAALRANGIDPFQNKFTPTETCAAARISYAEGREVTLAGRITAHRDMGKSMFIDITDGSGPKGTSRMQVYAQKNVLGDEQWKIFIHLDLADFIGVKGTMFTTKTGEISVKITGFTILAKALRPPPAKWHGLEDTEIRYRQRYLDLIGNPDVKETFLKRSAIVHEIRQFFHGRGYVEVETPVMQAIPGGAAAQPFKTFHNTLGCDFYLRIALELYHKRLLVGGIDRLFEIGKTFRNEGLSRRHNPEFTMLEAYQAFGDYETMMETVETLITTVAQKVWETTKIKQCRDIELRTELEHLLSDFREMQKECLPSDALRNLWSEWLDKVLAELNSCLEQIRQQNYFELALKAIKAIEEFKTNFEGNPTSIAYLDKYTNYLNIFRLDIHKRQQKLESLSVERVIDLTPPWPKRRYKDLVREKIAEVTQGETPDWFALPDSERRFIAENLRIDGLTFLNEDFEVTGAVFEKLVEPTLIQPTFVTHLPKELVPLAKVSPDDSTTVEVFECCINGQEIAPGYTEQNDPIAQRSTLEHQAGGEQQKLDEDFLVALEHGMPPAGGIGIGIDRLCMMLLGQESIRDVILFPQLKPK